MSNNKRSAEKEAFWREVLQQYQRSGLSVRSFCERKGIAEQSFYAWRKKLKSRDAEREAPSQRSEHRQQQSLIPLSVVDPDGAQGSVANGTPTSPLLEVITPQGVTVRLHRYIDPQQLDLLMAVISRIPSGGVPAC